MNSSDCTAWVSRASLVTPSCTDPDVIHAALDALARLAGAVEAQRLVCARALSNCSPLAVVGLAAGSRAGRRDAHDTMNRLAVVDRAPALGNALTAGQIVGAHVDRLGGALRRLEPDQQHRLLAEIDSLVTIAASTDADDFDRHLRQRERSLRTDDGQALYQRQQAAVRLATWTNRQDGMHHWKLTVDPHTAVALDSRLRAMTDTLFHAGNHPPHAPTDALERHSFLQAHALIAIITGSGTAGGGIRLGRPEHIIVEDRRVPAGHPPVYDLGLPIELPPAVIAEMVRPATTVTITLDDGDVVSAPGPLDLGRTQRLANPAQRRALRALYANCAIPGCLTRYDHCTIHHVIPWEHHGPTNLDNLIPLCTTHHHNIHDHHWHLHLTPNRDLHVTPPGKPAITAEPNRHHHTLHHTTTRAGP